MKRFIFALALGLLLLTTGCNGEPDFDDSLDSITKPHAFSLAKWEWDNLPDDVKDALVDRTQVKDEVGTVLEYFSLRDEIRTRVAMGAVTPESEELRELRRQQAALTDDVEKIIKKQVKVVFAEQGIYNPANRTKIQFPPLSFELQSLPRLLVVSPRERIESIEEVLLQPDIKLEEIEEVEDEVDALGVSSLVVGLGGFSGTLPVLVSDSSDLSSTLEVVAHEWLHHYLVFRPLGFRYLLDNLGFARNYDVATMNETAVDMAGKEIGKLVYERYYASLIPTSEPQPPAPGSFDFNKEMRELRRAVDEMLARVEVESAEALMEQKREELAEHGYYIRKLNQAYFAFFGTYADEPTSVSPIGEELKELRARNASLRDFIDQVAGMSSREDLRLAVEEAE